MKYIYTESDCPKCVELKEQLKKDKIIYIERHSSRIKSPEDEADREALIQASMQNLLIPVVVDLESQND